MPAPDPSFPLNAALQPSWTPTGSQDKTSTTYDVDNGASPGQREIVVRRQVVEDGIPVTLEDEAALPHLPYVNMLDPSGNVCQVVVSGNRVRAQPSPTLHLAQMRSKHRKGWVLWDWSPKDEPAQVEAKTAEGWAVARERMRKERMAKAKATSKQFETVTRDNMAEALKKIGDNGDVLNRFMADLAAGRIPSELKAAAKANKSKGEE